MLTAWTKVTRECNFFFSLSLFFSSFYILDYVSILVFIEWLTNRTFFVSFLFFVSFSLPSLFFSLFFFLFARSKLEMKRYSSINRPIRRSIQRFFHREQGYLIFHSWNTISTVDSTTEDANVGKLHSAL